MNARTRLGVVLCLLGAATSAAVEQDSWYQPLPRSLAAVEQQPISDSSFFEVAASMESTAEYLLAKESSIAQTPDNFAYFGQHNFHCPAATKPYLVRAVFTNGGTGKFYVGRVQQFLVVAHMSLGRASTLQRSALIVCLDFSPVAVYQVVGGAM